MSHNFGCIVYCVTTPNCYIMLSPIPRMDWKQALNKLKR